MKKIASSIIMTFMIFTGELLKEFKHRNIADNHVCNGEMKKGFRCRANSGGFVWKKGITFYR